MGLSDKTKTLLLVLIILLVYFPALHAGFVWDDGTFIYNNKVVQTNSGLWKIWFAPSTNKEVHYWPLTYSVFWIEYHLWNIHPFGYHLVNVLLHLLNVILLWKILRYLSIPGAWIAAAIFALHPVHVESVAWIIELKGLLSSTFILLSFLTYFYFDSCRSWRFYILSLIFLILAIFSKTTAVSLPFIILLILWWKKDRLSKNDYFLLIPYFVIVLLFSITDLHFFYQHRQDEIFLSFPQKFIMAGWNSWFYFEKLLFPLNLMTIYPQWKIDTHNSLQYFFSLSIVVIVGILWWQRKFLGKSPLTAVLFYLLTLAPTLGFISFGFMTYSFVADRYQYIPSIGPIVLFTACIIKYNNRFIQAILIPILLMFLGLLTWQHAATYQNIETLFGDNIKKNPTAWLAHFNLAGELIHQEKYEKAVEHYIQALQYCPQPERIYIALGNTYIQLKKYNEAMEQYNKVLRDHPTNAVISNNIGVIAANQGNLDDAQTCYLKALEINPSLAIAYYNLGLIKITQEKYDAAQDYFSHALSLNPELASAHCNLGTLLARQGKIEEAIAHFSRASRIQSNYFIANANLEKAIAAYKEKQTVLILPFDTQPQTAS